MFDWTEYFRRLALADQRERIASDHRHRRTPMSRAISQTIKDCAPLLPRKRNGSRPRDPKLAS